MSLISTLKQKFAGIAESAIGTVKSTLKQKFAGIAESAIGTVKKVAAVGMLGAAMIVAMPTEASAQNLGQNGPAHGKAVQGQQAYQVEGSIVNVVNWVANVICPVLAGLAVVACVIQWRTGNSWMPTAATAAGLLAVSGILRLIEYFIQQGRAVSYLHDFMLQHGHAIAQFAQDSRLLC